VRKISASLGETPPAVSLNAAFENALVLVPVNWRSDQLAPRFARRATLQKRCPLDGFASYAKLTNRSQFK
jgi:hypothetical protein